jgi:hypothetical protein
MPEDRRPQYGAESKDNRDVDGIASITKVPSQSSLHRRRTVHTHAFNQPAEPKTSDHFDRQDFFLPTPVPHQKLKHVAVLSPPIGQFIINIIIQALGLGAAIAFGVYAVKSVTAANDANKYASEAILQAVMANKLAILAVCTSSSNLVCLSTR